MKNIFKFLFLLTFTVTLFSCDNEDQAQLTISPKGAGEITSPEAGTVFVLNPEENQTNTIFTITWNSANYDVPTAINYVVEFAKAGTAFAEPFVAGSTSNTYLSLNIGEFNGAVVGAGLTPFTQEELEVRITSTVGRLGSTPQISEPITILVTPFTTDLPIIAVPGYHQGWKPATAPLLASSAFGKTDYEGFVWLSIEGGDSEGFKFVGPDATGFIDWGAGPEYGDDGTFTGKLVTKDGKNCKVAATGYYFVKADTDKLTYTTEIMNWSLTGNATALSWPPGGSDGVAGNDYDMTYDPDTKTLSVTLDLTANFIKFRANDAWDINLGDTGADGLLEFGGSDIAISEAGNYTVTLDLSKPREYTYSLVKNN
ncbi:MAG: DUF5116 domain-containing protein [Bacteroidetes bacterium HGW-Bacteroidetes-3]|nr:MAG: DUF5116 domain-containing protein [Bacteroidetes bacterium HGW-Bacteroidetes-3]